MVTQVKAVTKPITTHEVARRAVNKSLAGLAGEIGVDRSYASRVEAGEVPASERYRRGFARACGVAANEIFDIVTHKVSLAMISTISDDELVE